MNDGNREPLLEEWRRDGTSRERPMSEPSNMYAEAKTWNPFKGCAFDCVYCVPSFQRQAKRQKWL